ncbi:MAG: hypothetical protein ACFFG0_04345 [Candidatus Thorarchaeota archaeon]
MSTPIKRSGQEIIGKDSESIRLRKQEKPIREIFQEIQPEIERTEEEIRRGSIHLSDFKPINKWKIDKKGKKFKDGRPMHIIDLTTGRKYLNENKSIIRIKCFLLLIGITIFFPFILVINTIDKILCTILLIDFWGYNKKKEHRSFKVKVLKQSSKLLNIITVPIHLIGLQLSSIYGFFRPYDGRKLYSSFEKLLFKGTFLGPCFHPDPKKHLFGGDIRKRDQF